MEVSFRYGSKSSSDFYWWESVRRDIHDITNNGKYIHRNVLLQKILCDLGPRKQHCQTPRDHPPTKATEREIQITNVGTQGITEDDHLTMTTNLYPSHCRKRHW